ncbi:MFS transporter [Francisella frigiditurris]|uniref:Sugar (And other) transporter family protein n=1 Tax=Francisella frigiditurris TaxID=1542390 RepID=A0A1J0KTR1_9GAMM|nr:MFS transporter [Francisella frigiditurris]APC97090.1 sugar (and other) transporter family protein [Francisella frigiditurris]
MNNKISLTALIIWITCAVFFMYEFLLRTILGTFEHQIISDLDLTLVTFSILSSTAYQFIYGIMQVPVGFITDKLGLKKTLTMAVGICALGVGMFALSNSFSAALVYRVLMGFGSAFGFLCLLVAVYDWLPHKYIGLFIGLSQFIGVLGPMVAAGPLDSLSNTSGIDWREVFIILAGVGVILAIITVLIVKNNKQSDDKFVIIDKPISILDNIKSLISTRQVWFIAFFSASVYFSIEFLSENAAKPFLMLHSFDPKVASYMITLAWLGYGIGCPSLGFISDTIKRRKPIMIFSAILAFFALAVIIFIPINIYILSIAFICLGIGASGQSIGFAIIAEQCQKYYLAAGLGVNNFLIMLSVSIGSPFISYVLSNLSDGKKITISEYEIALCIPLLFIVVGIILSIFFIRETFCRSTKEVITVEV